MSVHNYQGDETRPLIEDKETKGFGFHSGEFTGSHQGGGPLVGYTIDRDNGTEIYTQQQPQTGRLTKNVRNIVLALLNILFNVTINVTLPIYAGTMGKVGGDAYVLLSQACIWFVVLFVIMTVVLHFTMSRSITLRPTASYKILLAMGFCTTLNGVLVVFASPPDRTPPYLQALLFTVSIPFTVICRLIILRKGINLPRSICTCSVIVGMIITALPQVWGLPGSGGSTGGDNNESVAARILWPLCFALGFLPYGIMNVLCEKELQSGEGTSFSFITWTNIFQLLTMYPMFWTDFIPGFGMASSPSDFFDRLRIGWTCSFSSAASCMGLAGKAWLFAIAYCLGNLFQFMLIQYAEGAVYAAVVQAVVSPTAALFWTLFKFDVDANRFYWGPEFTETTAFTAVGVSIIVPCVALYNYFSVQEEKENQLKKEREDNSL